MKMSSSEGTTAVVDWVEDGSCDVEVDGRGTIFVIVSSFVFKFSSESTAVLKK